MIYDNHKLADVRPKTSQWMTYLLSENQETNNQNYCLVGQFHIALRLYNL